MKWIHEIKNYGVIINNLFTELNLSQKGIKKYKFINNFRKDNIYLYTFLRVENNQNYTKEYNINQVTAFQISYLTDLFIILYTILFR